MTGLGGGFTGTAVVLRRVGVKKKRLVSRFLGSPHIRRMWYTVYVTALALGRRATEKRGVTMPDATENWQRIQEKMYRCDRAVALVRGNRLNRKDANELINATLNLLNEIRLQHNEAKAR